MDIVVFECYRPSTVDRSGLMNTDDLVSVVAALVGVGAAVAAAWFARRSASSDAKRSVDELAANVEHLARITRREQMRRVRASATGAEGGSDPMAGPPELRAVPEAANPADRKAALRQRMQSIRGGR